MKLMLPLIVALTVSAGSDNHDVVLNAMSDELTRSIEQLKIDQHEKPYYISYLLDDLDAMDIHASFGAITGQHQRRYRNLSTDVHVGSYRLDSGNMRQGNHFGGNQSLDDDYDALRHSLWLQTDAAYKHAVQNLEVKKANLQQKNIKERPDDWSREQPVVLLQAKQVLAPDRARWTANLKTLSSLFKRYPKIRQSTLSFTETAENKYFVNSEGSRIRVADEGCWLTVSATGQAEDGMKVSDSISIMARNEAHMPSTDQLEASIKQLAERLTVAVEAKEAELYQGPILLEGDAAGEFFNKVLAPNIVVRRPLDTEGISRAEDNFQARIGRRLLPNFISVVDDPTLKDVSGTMRPGSYDIDDQGIRAQRVELVEKGILKTLLSTRLPTLKVKNSNGHAHGVSSVRASNLIIQSAEKLDRENLRTKLLKLGKDEGLDYVLIVRKLSSGAKSGVFSFDADSFGGERLKDKVDLPPALDIYRLYVADGHEEPLRSAEFGPCTIRILRDIVATGDDDAMYSPVSGSGSAASVTTPSIILDNVEMQKTHADLDKPPTLPHPYFEKQQGK